MDSKSNSSKLPPASSSGGGAHKNGDTTHPPPHLVDIGVNLTNKAFRTCWKAVVKRAVDSGVETILLTGTSLPESRKSIRMAHEWFAEQTKNEATKTAAPPGRNLYCTVGVHPHDAKSYQHADDDDHHNDNTVSNKPNKASTTQQLKQLLVENPGVAVAVGECGLDYNRNYSSPAEQLQAFRAQVDLACDLGLPLFVHEREAHADVCRVFDEAISTGNNAYSSRALPPVVIHCFTGTELEAQTYIDRGFYIGFTGTICKKERGAPLREILPKIPLDKIMIETDAPFMGFKKGRRGSEPADAVGVAEKISEIIGVPFETVAEITTCNAMRFFGLRGDAM